MCSRNLAAAKASWPGGPVGLSAAPANTRDDRRPILPQLQGIRATGTWESPAVGIVRMASPEAPQLTMSLVETADEQMSTRQSFLPAVPSLPEGRG